MRGKVRFEFAQLKLSIPMMLELQIIKAGEVWFTYAFPGRDRNRTPEDIKRALEAFYDQAPDVSLPDDDVSLKLIAHPKYGVEGAT